MKNFFTPSLDNDQMHKLSTLALAHIGDGVFELLTRSFLITEGLLTAKNLHKGTISLVKASSQAKFCDIILDELTEEEKSVFLRGRNSKPKIVPKSCTREEYAKATALEALFGYLYLKQNYDRINYFFGKISENFEI